MDTVRHSGTARLPAPRGGPGPGRPGRRRRPRQKGRFARGAELAGPVGAAAVRR